MDLKELKILFEELSQWIETDMQWSGVTSDEILTFYDTFEAVSSENGKLKIKKKKLKELVDETGNEANSFKAKFIVLHIALLTTCTVNSNGQYCYKHYNPGRRHYLYKFLCCSFEKSRAKKLLQVFEKCFGEFIFNELQFLNQDPVESPMTSPFKLPEFEDRVSYINFINFMSENKDMFEKYVEETHPPANLGETGESRYDSLEKVIQKKFMILKKSKKLIEETKENMISQFEKISPECDLGRHAVITVSGFLSEKDDNTDSWKGLCKANSTLPVYSYRWSSKATWSMLKPIIPSSVKSFFSLKNMLKKIFFTYRLITLPFDYREIFLHSIKMAKKSGKLLAHSLMMQFPFINHSISLVGFSLGTQVIYSCLEELKSHGADNISKQSL